MVPWFRWQDHVEVGFNKKQRGRAEVSLHIEKSKKMDRGNQQHIINNNT